jgi:parallel beta-helix repeat protein
MTALLGISAGAPLARADSASRIYYVDTTGDAGVSANANACENDLPDGDCTLRQAIEKSNVDGGTSTIDFTRLPTSDPNYDITTGRWTILPTQQLPTLSDSAGGTLVVGRNDNPTFTPRIVIDGTALVGDGNGFRLTSAGNVLSRLIIVRFRGNSLTTGAGVRITGTGATDNQIVGSYIGNFPGVLTQAGNQQAGVLIDQGAKFNRVGASGSNRNVISGNGYDGSGNVTFGDGVRINGSTTSDNVVQGNYIGTGLTTAFVEGALSNTGYGIQIAESPNNSIGGNANERNVISANGRAGIIVTGSSASSNNIFSNYIGTGSDGLADFGNGQSGVVIADGATNNTIGNAVNVVVISGNAGYGVLITDNGTTNNTVRDSYIGVNESAAIKVPNDQGGVRIQENASNNSIGLAGASNVISGNTGYGVSIGRVNPGIQFTTGNTIRNNVIGLDLLSKTKLDNTLGGVLVDSSAKQTVIGGTAGSEGNVISGNGPAGATTPTGIIVNATEVLSTTITGNVIGLKRAVTNGPFNTAEGNQGGGVLVAQNAQRVQIGGAPEQGNTISRNLGDGVLVNTGATGIEIRSNDVMTNTLRGINLAGVTQPVIEANRANDNQGGSGIQVSGAPDVQLLGNTASGNSQSGIAVTASARAVLEGNTADRNTENGLLVSGTDAARINANAAQRNTQNGIQVDTGSARVTLSFNTVLTNTLNGINLNATSPFTVTTNELRGNVTGSGLLVTGPATNSRIVSNQATRNGGNGMQLVAPSATTNITFTTNFFNTNTGSGLRITGDAQNILVERNTFLNNAINGLEASGAAPRPQRVRINNNSFTGNGVPSNATLPVGSTYSQYGIVLEPNPIGSPGDPTNVNHDIDPPIKSSLVAGQNGVFTGRVLADGSNAACGANPANDCTLELFGTSATTLDGQGSEFLVVPITVDSTGRFTATLGYVPTQLALTATDKNGNTSEFETYDVNPQLTIGPAQAVSAKPGDSFIIQHTVTNTGNVAFTSLALSATSDKADWVVAPIPTGTFALAPGQTKVVSVTVSLPNGPATSVSAGTVGKVSLTVSSGFTQNASVTQTVEDTVTVLERVVLSVTPGSQSGSGKPGTDVVYPHTVTNLGNTNATIAYTAITTVDGLPAPTWITSVTPPPTLTLAPGQSAGLAVHVTVSPSAQSGPPPTIAKTTLRITPTTTLGVDLTQVKVVTDTTTTTLNQLATMVPDRQGDAGATETITFRHTVTNLSSGEATFKLSASSSQGSQITFRSDTSGVTLVNGNTFTIPNTPGSNQFSFLVDVKVARHVLPGQQDIVTIVLNDAAGGPIGGASVQDTINVTRGVMFPRLYLPIVVKP